MERFSSKRPAQPSANTQQRPAAPASAESFSEMANVTAAKPGIAGKLLVISLIIVSIAITGFVGYAIFSGVDETESANATSLVKSDQYQAVFLTDGQIYFGKVEDVSDKFTTLTNIYYLQVEQQVQPDRSEEQAQPRVSLAKLGNELHGPEDEMFINNDQILFWENLKTDGQVTEAINNYLAEQNQ